MKLIYAALVLGLTVPAWANNTLEKTLDIRVCPSDPLPVLLQASPATILPGDSSTLSWSAPNGASLTLNPGGPVTGNSASVSPAGIGPHTYTLTAVNDCKQTGTASVTITVRKLRVFLEGSRRSNGPSVANYMLTPGMYCYDCIGGALITTAKNFADPRLGAGAADLNAFVADVGSWNHSVEAYNTPHRGGNTYIVDERGDVLGSIPTLSLYNTGVPGLSYMGDPYNTHGRNRLWAGSADFQWKGKDYEVVGFLSASPIVLDLDGNGKPDVDRGVWLPHPGRFNRSRAVLFDITATGFPNLTEWIGPRDGLLVAPLKDGETVSGKELFGNPIGYTDGYQKLGMLYDENHDGWISGKELDGFMVWQDLNSNGRVDPGELKPAQAWGITRISTRQKNLKSKFVMNGKERATWDWWPTSMLVYPKPVAMKP